MTSIDLRSARQAVVDNLMPDTYTITRSTPVADGGGGFTDGAPTTISGVCGFTTNNGQLEQGGDHIQQRGTYRMRVPVDAAIHPTDLPVLFGRTFRIVWTPPVHSLALLPPASTYHCRTKGN